MEVVRVLLSISYETPVSELHAPPPVLSVPPAAPVAALLFEHALGGFGKGRNALDAALLREGIAARAGQLAVGERNVTGFGERDEPDGAEFQLAPSSADDEPLDPAPGAFGLDVEEQAVAVGVPAGRRGADDDGRERLVGVPASWLGSAGCGGGFDYRASRQRELCNVCKLLIQRCLREQRLACFPQRLPLYGRECTGPSKSTRNPVPSSSEPADCDQVPTPAPAVEGLRDALATPGLAGDRGGQRVVCTRQTFSRRLNGRTGISPAMLLALERIGRSNAAVWGARRQVLYDLVQNCNSRARVVQDTEPYSDPSASELGFEDTRPLLGALYASRPMSLQQGTNDVLIGSCDSLGLLQYRSIDVLESSRGQPAQGHFVPRTPNTTAPENKSLPIQRHADHTMTLLRTCLVVVVVMHRCTYRISTNNQCSLARCDGHFEAARIQNDRRSRVWFVV